MVGDRGRLTSRAFHGAIALARAILALTREVLVPGGIALGWILASAALLFLKPLAGALFVTALSVLLVAIHVWIPRQRGREDLLAALRAHPLPGRRNWILAAVVLTPVWGVALALLYNQLVPLTEIPPDLFTAYAEAQGGWLAVAILVVLFSPMLEEFVLRGWIQGSLERRVSPAVAIILAALLFALLHGNAERLLLYFCVGSFFGWAVWQSGTVWAAVLLHCSYNAGLLAVDGLVEVGVGPVLFDPETEFGAVGLVLLFVVMVSAVTGVVFFGRFAGRAQSPPAIGLTPDGLGS